MEHLTLERVVTKTNEQNVSAHRQETLPEHIIVTMKTNTTQQQPEMTPSLRESQVSSFPLFFLILLSQYFFFSI